MELRTSSELSNLALGAARTSGGTDRFLMPFAAGRAQHERSRGPGMLARLAAAAVLGLLAPATARAGDDCYANIEFIAHDGIPIPTKAPCDFVARVTVSGPVIAWHDLQVVHILDGGGELREQPTIQQIGFTRDYTLWKGHAECVPGAIGFRVDVYYMSCPHNTGTITNMSSRTIYTTCGGEPPRAGLSSLAPGSPRALSADGAIVAGTVQVSGKVHAALWNQSTGWRDLDPQGTVGWSYPTAVSADGSTVAGSMGPQSNIYGFGRTFRWTKSGGFQDISAPTTWYLKYFDATAISADGSTVVGDLSYGGPFSPVHAAIWSEATGVVDLGVPLGQDASSTGHATAVSADGSVLVGWTSITHDDSRAFRRTKSGDIQDLGLLTGGTSAAATAISADGSIVAGIANVQTNQGLVFHAFRWTSSGGMQDLGARGSESRNDTLYRVSMSADGSVVMFNGRFTQGADSFIWTTDLAKCVSLQTYLETSGLPLGSNVFAYLLSGDGTTIVGNSDTGAWVLNHLNPTWSVPSILAQPEPIATCASGTAQFSVAPAGTGLFDFQWQWLSQSGQWVNFAEGLELDSDSGLPLFRAAGSLGSQLTIEPPTAGGSYPIALLANPILTRCIVRNTAGSTTSNDASLAICFADHNCDTFTTGDDFDAFAIEYEQGAPAADTDGNGWVTGDDFDLFIVAFEAGC